METERQKNNSWRDLHESNKALEENANALSICFPGSNFQVINFNDNDSRALSGRGEMFVIVTQGIAALSPGLGSGGLSGHVWGGAGAKCRRREGRLLVDSVQIVAEIQGWKRVRGCPAAVEVAPGPRYGDDL